jgi:hypothetical protein
MATQRVCALGNGDQAFHRGPDCIHHFRVKRAHDRGDLHSVVGVLHAPDIKTGNAPRPVDGHHKRDKTPGQTTFPLTARPLNRKLSRLL